MIKPCYSTASTDLKLTLRYLSENCFNQGLACNSSLPWLYPYCSSFSSFSSFHFKTNKIQSIAVILKIALLHSQAKGQS